MKNGRGEHYNTFTKEKSLGKQLFFHLHLKTNHCSTSSFIKIKNRKCEEKIYTNDQRKAIMMSSTLFGSRTEVVRLDINYEQRLCYAISGLPSNRVNQSYRS